MRVLLIGSGGREHALAWKLAQSPLLAKLFIAPGNPGIAAHGECVALNISDNAEVVAFALRERIDLVVVGPEQPLVNGLADVLGAAGIRCFGPSKAAARLEGSKGFTKDLCARHNIPTATYARFSERDAARAYVQAQGAPIVIKADGLAAGKGVVVAMTLTDALEAVDAIFETPAGAHVVIEAFLQGEEASFFVLSDGVHALPLAAAQDHKRVGEGDTGPNTGGMGAYSPAPVMTDALVEQTMQRIILPTLDAMRAAGTPFAGVLFAGLMINSDGPQLIEYNCRFGDPECQALMLRMESDLLPLLIACCDGTLDAQSASWRPGSAIAVVMAARGYPGEPLRGAVIRGIDTAAAQPDVQIFHAGTSLNHDSFIANGGRVLGVCAIGENLRIAQQRAYRAVDCIDWPEGFCRRDIGWRALD